MQYPLNDTVIYYIFYMQRENISITNINMVEMYCTLLISSNMKGPVYDAFNSQNV